MMASGTPDGLVLFKQQVHSNIARWVNRLRHRRGKFWERRGASSRILDEASNWERLEYLYTNPVKADLCKTAEAWPGFTTLPESLGRPPRVYEYLDREAYNRARKRHPEVDREQFITRHTLKVSPLPGYAHDPDGFARELSAMLARTEEDLTAQRRLAKKKLIPRKKLLSIRWTDAPRHTKRSPRPLCHSSCPERKAKFLESYREFCHAYRVASTAYRDGELTVSFPEGAFRPTLPASVTMRQLLAA